jgi:hypothetical protein
MIFITNGTNTSNLFIYVHLYLTPDTKNGELCKGSIKYSNYSNDDEKNGTSLSRSVVSKF